MNAQYKYKTHVNEDDEGFEEGEDELDYSKEAPKLESILSTNGNILTMHINAGISDASLNAIINAIMHTNSVSGNVNAVEATGYEYVKQINLMISSPGGSLKPTDQLLAAMDTSRIPIRTIGWGELASAAVVIFMAGHERLMSEHAIIMSHNASCSTPPMMHVDDGAAEDMRKLISSQMMHKYLKYTGKDKAYIKRHLLKSNRQDSFFAGSKAIEHGIADKLFTHTSQLNVVLPERTA